MSAEDLAAIRQQITSDQFEAILRVVREAVRAEMRAEFEGRKCLPELGRVSVLNTDWGPVEVDQSIHGGDWWVGHALRHADTYYATHGTIEGFKPQATYSYANQGRSDLQQAQSYEVPPSVAGVPV